MSISKRLEELVSNPHLKANKRDYNFAVSLQEAYQRQGRLTPGRRPWLDKLEEKYSAEAVAERQTHLQSPIVVRLEQLLSRIEDRSSWACGFTESVLSQAKEGKILSRRQLEIVAKLERENTDEVWEQRAGFTAQYNDESTGLKERTTIASRYYMTTPYFRDIAREVLEKRKLCPHLISIQ